MRTTVLFSGGIDSTSCVHFLQARGHDVEGLFIDFGQPAADLERRAVETLRSKLGVPTKTISVSGNTRFGSGEILGRNAFFVFSALLFRGHRDCQIVLGIHSGVSYFDTTSAFLSQINGVVQGYTNGSAVVSAPFIEWKKDDVYSYFLGTKIKLGDTYSCEAGEFPSCGECPSCLDRKRIECLPNDGS
jgi:7-cyano-7-deazaguanine synthase